MASKTTEDKPLRREGDSEKKQVAKDSVVKAIKGVSIKLLQLALMKYASFD